MLKGSDISRRRNSSPIRSVRHCRLKRPNTCLPEKRDWLMTDRSAAAERMAADRCMDHGGRGNLLIKRPRINRHTLRESLTKWASVKLMTIMEGIVDQENYHIFADTFLICDRSDMSWVCSSVLRVTASALRPPACDTYSGFHAPGREGALRTCGRQCPSWFLRRSGRLQSLLQWR